MEQPRPDIARKRTGWKAHHHKIDPKQLVFIDETWVKPNMASLLGWGPRGQRLDGGVSHRQWKTLTFIGALRHDRIDAPGIIDGPINSDLFTAYIQKGLVPNLKKATLSSWTTSARTRARPPEPTSVRLVLT